ncbi:hypothetical protein PRIC1_009544 [Phytophthora ramorum]
MKIRARAVSSDNTKPTIVLNLPGVRLAVLMSAYDSFVHLDVTLSSAATLLLATYVACVLTWNVLGEKERQAPAVRRRMLAQLNRNRLLVNVVPGDMRCRIDMNLGEANCVGKAFVQAMPGQRKPFDVYVMRVDCGAQSADQEKHTNLVVMWDVTATFDKFKQLERELKKEAKAIKASRGVQVPHVSSGAVLFVQPELTDHVLNARLQTFIDIVRSDPVLSTMGCLRKFCQTYQAAQPQCARTRDCNTGEKVGCCRARVENEFVEPVATKREEEMELPLYVRVSE